MKLQCWAIPNFGKSRDSLPGYRDQFLARGVESERLQFLPIVPIMCILSIVMIVGIRVFFKESLRMRLITGELFAADIGPKLYAS